MAKFEKGRTCLVLKALGNKSIVGKTVVLDQKFEDYVLLTQSGVSIPKKGANWSTNLPVKPDTVTAPAIIFLESWLLPLDDPDDFKQIEQHDAAPIEVKKSQPVDEQVGINLQLQNLAEEFAKLAKMAEQMRREWKEIIRGYEEGGGL